MKGVFIVKTLDEYVDAVEACRKLGEQEMSDDQNTSSGTSSDGLGQHSGGITEHDPANDTSGAEHGLDPVADPKADPAATAPAYSAHPAKPEAVSTVPGPLSIAPPAADAEGDIRRAHISTLVEEWWNDHMPGSVVGRNVEIWNYVHGTKDALKTKLEQWLKPQAPVGPEPPHPPEA